MWPDDLAFRPQAKVVCQFRPAVPGRLYVAEAVVRVVSTSGSSCSGRRRRPELTWSDQSAVGW